jgi:hypothetical protein
MVDDIRINPEPRYMERLPFASESALQHFVTTHAKDLLGIEVVAIAERGGGMISKIDILAVSPTGKLWIIECKHDLVEAGAGSQLKRYRASVLARWPEVRKTIVSRWPGRLKKNPQLGLMTIGYRYDPDFAADDIVGIAYRYHGIEFTNDRLQQPRPGLVSLHRKQDIVMPAQPHPRVAKDTSILTRLAQLDPSLVACFWNLDRELKKLPGVNVTYGGKNLVRYRTAGRVFAVAAIHTDAIEWRIKQNQVVSMRSPSDIAETLRALQKARQNAG